MSKHTQGPWIYKATAGNHDFAVYPESTGQDVALVRNFNEANARLISAAPELFAACKEVLAAFPPSQYRGKHLPPQLESYIRAAIAKASGE